MKHTFGMHICIQCIHTFNLQITVYAYNLAGLGDHRYSTMQRESDQNEGQKQKWVEESKLNNSNNNNNNNNNKGTFPANPEDEAWPSRQISCSL